MIMLNHNLRIFIHVAEKKSITEVANKLYISQPAVSKAIKNLEEELKLKLFYRNKRVGLVLTDAGHKILLLARQMADIENRIYQTAFRENNFLGGKVKIATMPIITSVILSKVFYEFKKKYPLVTIELIEGSSIEIRHAVEEHQVDFGITASPFGDLEYEVLLKDEMTAISKEIFSENFSINLYENPETYIFCKAGHETAMDKLKSYKINLENSFIVQQAETVISLVEQRNGIGIISKLVLCATPHNLNLYSIEPKIEIDIGLVAVSLNDLTPVAMELKRMICDEIKNSPIYNKINL